MSFSFGTFFKSVGHWFEAHFGNVPQLEIQIASTVNYLVPFIITLDDLLDPAYAGVIDPIILSIKMGLSALATTIRDSSPNGKANVISILQSIQTNSKDLLTAFKVKDKASQDRATSLINLITNEAQAMETEFASQNPTVTASTPAIALGTTTPTPTV